MPQPALDSLKTICIDFIAQDKETNFNFDGIVPTLPFEVLKRKLDLYNLKFKEGGTAINGILTFKDVDNLIRPGLKQIDLSIPFEDLGCKILTTIGRTQRTLKKVRIHRQRWEDSDVEDEDDEINTKMAEAIQDFSKALKTVINFEFRIGFRASNRLSFS